MEWWKPSDAKALGNFFYSPENVSLRAFEAIDQSNLTDKDIEAAPATFHELAWMTSIPEAFALCEAYPGFELKMPRSDSDYTQHTALRGELKALLSQKSYERLLELSAGCTIYFPRIDKLKRRIRERQISAEFDRMSMEGVSSTKIIAALGLKWGHTRSYLYRLLKKGTV